jgi:hypothetical protein
VAHVCERLVVASTWSHFWGMATSAALLSLGAPFWFNLLKTLSNLRPILADPHPIVQKENPT